MWHRGLVRVDAFRRYEQQVVLVITDQSGGPCLLSDVDMSTEHRDQSMLKIEISRLLMQGLPSLVARDFNCIMGPNKKRGGRQQGDSIESREFRDFINNTGLINLDFTGSRFTWCNN